MGVEVAARTLEDASSLHSVLRVNEDEQRDYVNELVLTNVDERK